MDWLFEKLKGNELTSFMSVPLILYHKKEQVYINWCLVVTSIVVLIMNSAFTFSVFSKIGTIDKITSQEITLSNETAVTNYTLDFGFNVESVDK